MPLSEHEERALAEIERRLAEDDPRFVATVTKATTARARLVRLRWAITGFVIGLLLLLGLTFHFAFGVAGFALMLVSVVVGVEALRGLSSELRNLRLRLPRRDRSDRQ